MFQNGLSLQSLGAEAVASRTSNHTPARRWSRVFLTAIGYRGDILSLSHIHICYDQSSKLASLRIGWPIRVWANIAVNLPASARSLLDFRLWPANSRSGLGRSAKLNSATWSWRMFSCDITCHTCSNQTDLGMVGTNCSSELKRVLLGTNLPLEVLEKLE
ncbi:hypothetical protein TNCV_2618181 [Trichonephila clavipes]|nr:hypothetical protein TNCV_2618181 [Trichonephila clavipes]